MMEDKVDEFKQELVECKKELVKIKQLEEDLIKDEERVFVECNKLNNKSVHVKVRHDALVEKLKNKLFGVMFEQKEEEHVEAEDKKKETYKEHVLDARMEYFEENKLDS